ncbi:hypothetical protein ACLBXI_29900 [Bacillus cereus]
MLVNKDNLKKYLYSNLSLQVNNSTNLNFNNKKYAYTPQEVAKLYDFPLHVNCNSQSIGIIALGGGYDVADLKTYFHHILRWYSKTGTQYRDKLFYIRGVSDEKTV